MMSSLGTPRAESEDQLRLRFQVELEFVQCLANPNYLNFLAQREHLKDPNFINYLRYLLYWKEPAYAKFLKYPMALTFLDLLQYSQFRKELMNNKCAKFIDDQQLLHWQHYIRKRCKLVGGAAAAASNPPPPVIGGPNNSSDAQNSSNKDGNQQSSSSQMTNSNHSQQNSSSTNSNSIK